jgi:DNA topoisomerase-2
MSDSEVITDDEFMPTIAPKSKPKPKSPKKVVKKAKKAELSDSEEELLNQLGNENGQSNGNKRLSVERIYQKKSQLEHILLRPDSYVGSIEFTTQQMWVYDEEVGMNLRDVSFVPGLYKIFDEILVNAADNKQRDRKMDTIKIEINP